MSYLLEAEDVSKQMEQEWFLAKELVGIAGLPHSQQGIHKRARLQNWEKRTRLGIKGGTYEYHYSSLPLEVQAELGLIAVQRRDIDEDIYQWALSENEKFEEESALILAELEQERQEMEAIANEFLRERKLLECFRKLPKEAQEIIEFQLDRLYSLLCSNNESAEK